MKKYRTFRVVFSVFGETEEKERCYYCNTEKKARERAEREYGKGIKIIYVEEVIV